MSLSLRVRPAERVDGAAAFDAETGARKAANGDGAIANKRAIRMRKLRGCCVTGKAAEGISPVLGPPIGAASLTDKCFAPHCLRAHRKLRDIMPWLADRCTDAH